MGLDLKIQGLKWETIHLRNEKVEKRNWCLTKKRWFQTRSFQTHQWPAEGFLITKRVQETNKKRISDEYGTIIMVERTCWLKRFQTKQRFRWFKKERKTWSIFYISHCDQRSIDRERWITKKIESMTLQRSYGWISVLMRRKDSDSLFLKWRVNLVFRWSFGWILVFLIDFLFYNQYD